MSKVATRFAPSPTGPLHIGGIRTALFNWLYAKNQKGSFFLRIGDTEKQRSKNEYKDQIIKSLDLIGIKPRKSPIGQLHIQTTLCCLKHLRNGTLACLKTYYLDI